MCFLINSLLFVGQSFVFGIDSFKVFLSLFKSWQSNSSWSIFWSLLPQGQFGAFIILKRCRYKFVFPWSVTIAAKFCVRSIFMFILSLTSGKKCFVIFPFLQFVHSLCHFLTISFVSSFNIKFFWILFNFPSCFGLPLPPLPVCLLVRFLLSLRVL